MRNNKSRRSVGSPGVVERLEPRQLFAADITGSFAGEEPALIEPSKAYRTVVQLRNVGDSAANGSASLGLYLSQDGAIDSGSILLKTVSRRISLRPGRTMDVPVIFYSQATASGGVYQLLARIIPSAGLADTDTTNKVFAGSSPVTVAAAAADLTAAVTQGLTGKIVIVSKHQKPVSVTVKVQNIGNVIARGKLLIALYATTHPTVNPSDSVLTDDSLGNVAIPAGRSKSFSVRFTPANTVPAGSFDIVAEVNAADAIPESDTADNFAASATAFTIINPSVPGGPFAYGPLKSTLASVGVGQSQQSTFSLFVGRATGSTAVEVDEFDANGNDLGPLTTLVDNGDTAAGDATAEDGIYTGTATIDSTAAGTRYFAAVLSDPLLASPVRSTEVTVVATPPPGPSLGGDLTASYTTVVVGTPEETTFTVPVTNATASAVVDVDEFDAQGNDLGKFTQLYDDGSQLNDDATAGDGIYTGVNTVGFAAPGTRFFAAVVTDPLAQDTLSSAKISVTGVAAETLAQYTADDAADQAVTDAVNTAIAGGGTVEMASAAAANALASDPNVEPGSVQTTATSVSWIGTDGTEYDYGSDAFDDLESVAPSDGSVQTNSITTVPHTAAPADIGTSSDAQEQVLVLSPFRSNYSSILPLVDESADVASALESSGYSVTFHSDSQVTLADFQNFSQYAAVAISTHGEVTPGGRVAICTGVPVTPALDQIMQPELENHSLGKMNIGIHLLNGLIDLTSEFYAISPLWIEHYDGGMTGTIVDMTACDSLANNGMSTACLNAGAGAYIGYDHTVSIPWAEDNLAHAFGTLLGSTNNTVGDIPGINTKTDPETYTEHGVKTDATFLMQGNPDATLSQGSLLKNYELYVQYDWPQNVRDLDTRTTFMNDSVGWDLSTGDGYVTWSGDNTGYGGLEWDTVDLEQAWVDGQFNDTTTIGVGCDWYAPAGGSGPASITVGLKNVNTGAIIDVVHKPVAPGTESAGSPDSQFLVTARLGGSSTNPTIQFSVAPN